MKYTVAALLGLSGLVTALPAIQDPPQGVRILPPGWDFTITSLNGPGCPDFGADPDKQRTTRTTFGENTMDGSEIYYWFIAYPHLRVELGGKEHSWCETEVKYTEYKDRNAGTKGADYQFRLHKNGTSIIATYDLEKGVKATFKFAYDVGEGVTDTIVWKGPLASGKYELQDTSPVALPPSLRPLPKCGSGTIKFRTDLYISGDEGKKGFVASEHSTDAEGKEQYYGIQQGFSYDWQKCSK
ncbi:hypothetical protein DPSP01_005831 [Paraphaeosphaeria sporulosa]